MAAFSSRPTFLLLGAAKCGTTSLYHYLGQHPEVLFSEPKEPVFFEAEYERGLDYYWRTYFNHWAGESAVGEARVYNLFLPFVPHRVHTLLPDARLLAILRNPVDRAFSLWWHRVAVGRESRSFEDALEENRRRLERGHRFEGEEGAKDWLRTLSLKTGGTRIGTYLDGGCYAEQLERYLELFRPEQLRVVLIEDLQADAQKLCNDLWSFIGVTPQSLSDSTPYNPARRRRRRPAQRRLHSWATSLRLSVWTPAPVRRRLRELLAGRPASRPGMDPETRRQLVEFFRRPNERLTRLLGRNLSHWNA